MTSTAPLGLQFFVRLLGPPVAHLVGIPSVVAHELEALVARISARVGSSSAFMPGDSPSRLRQLPVIGPAKKYARWMVSVPRSNVVSYLELLHSCPSALAIASRACSRGLRSVLL